MIKSTRVIEAKFVSSYHHNRTVAVVTYRLNGGKEIVLSFSAAQRYTYRRIGDCKTCFIDLDRVSKNTKHSNIEKSVTVIGIGYIVLPKGHQLFAMENPSIKYYIPGIKKRHDNCFDPEVAALIEAYSEYGVILPDAQSVGEMEILSWFPNFPYCE